jgi:hypothetical protein
LSATSRSFQAQLRAGLKRMPLIVFAEELSRSTSWR